jgi:hypothetical protein
LEWINSNGTDGIEFPIQVLLICYHILQTISPVEDGQSLNTRGILKMGYDLLNERTKQIQDPYLRRQFLENVPYNHDLLAAWKAINPD